MLLPTPANAFVICKTADLFELWSAKYMPKRQRSVIIIITVVTQTNLIRISCIVCWTLLCTFENQSTV